MPSSKPVYMGVLLYNGTKYAGMYFKSEKTDGSNTKEDQFYWLETDSKGAIIDYRANMINGWFSSFDSANSNKPSGYSDQVPINLDNEFVVSYFPAFYTDGTVSGFPYKINGVVQTDNMHKYTLDAISAMIDAGVNNIIFPLGLSYLYYNKAEYDMDTTGTDTAGINLLYGNTTRHNLDGLIKKAIDIIVSKGLQKKVSVSFRLEALFIREGWNNNTQWDPRLINDADLMVDNKGNISYAHYGRGSLSYASTNAKNISINFIGNILRRYKPYANDRGVKVHWTSIVTSQTSEAEYAYEQGDFGQETQALFDYSDVAIQGFRTWLQSTSGGNYTNIGALNTAWGSNFASFSAINKENIIGWNNGDATSLNKIFATKKGKDFYNYNVYNIVNFFSAIKDKINSYTNDAGAGGGTIKCMMEGGANLQQFDQNSSSYRRMTFDQSKIKDVYDFNKCWNSFSQGASDVRNQWGAFQCDFARSNSVLYEKKHGTELYANDFVTQQGIGATTNEILNAFKDVNTSLIKNKIKEIVYMSPNAFNASFFYQYESARLGIADAISKIKTITTFEEPTKEVTFTIDFLLENGITAIFDLWKSNGGTTSNRINLHIGDTTTGGGGSGEGGSDAQCTGALDYIIYKNGSQGLYHEYCGQNKKYASNVDNIGSNNGGNKYYNFDPTSGNYTGIDGGLTNTHFMLVLPTHSITNDGTTTSTLVRHNVEIYDQNGTFLMRNQQYYGFRKIAGVDSPLNNSHPSNATPNSKPIYPNGDSTFFFQLGQNYKIKIYNIEGVFTARIDAINVNTAIKYYEGKLANNGVLEFNIDPSKITTNYIRGLKIVLDRFSDTDTIGTTNIMSQIAP